MFPEPSFSTTALAIVSCTLFGSGIGALFGYLVGYDVGHDKADGECRKAIGPLRDRIQQLNEALIWRDFPEGSGRDDVSAIDEGAGAGLVNINAPIGATSGGMRKWRK